MNIMATKYIRNCLIICAIAALLPQASSAQVDWRQTLEPLTSRADLTECLISLDVKTPDVIWVLYENMALTYIEQAATFEAAMNRGTNDDNLTRWQRIKEWNNTHRELQHQFEDDIALALNERQQALWNSFTRQLRRQRILPVMDSFCAGIKLMDLSEALKTLDLNTSEHDDLAEPFNSYEESIDLMLVNWNLQYDEIITEMWEIRDLVQTGDKKALKAFARQNDRLAKLIFDARDLSNRFVTEMASHMEPENGQKFRAIVTRRDFPDLFLNGPADLTAQRLESFDELTDEQRGVIYAVYSDYKMERSVVRQQMISALRYARSQKQTDRRMAKIRELERNGEDVETYMEQLKGEYPDSQYLRKLRSLERQTCQTIRKMFSPEQFNKLPADVRLYLSVWSTQ